MASQPLCPVVATEALSWMGGRSRLVGFHLSRTLVLRFFSVFKKVSYVWSAVLGVTRRRINMVPGIPS